MDANYGSASNNRLKAQIVSHMFSGCRFLIILNLENMNTNNIFDMKYMYICLQDVLL